jgi:lipoprotein-anchoring transpeptidase ErfK/SrfK
VLKRGIPLTDYYSILSRAVASLDSNTGQARDQLFERARRMLLTQIQNDRARWTDAQAEAEVANFDAATDRIESEIARRTTHESIGRYRQHPPADRGAAVERDLSPAESNRGTSRVVMLGAFGLAGVLLVGLAAYALLGGSPAPSTATKSPGGVNLATAPEAAKKEAAKQTASRSSLDGDDLEPGVDGGSSDTGLPYYLRRQAVYYRTVYSPGMVVVDRSQRFLYLVQPQARALRYGIGVGGECAIAAGLYRIQSKSPQWPDWSPSPALLKRKSYPPRIAGGPGNPLGAYVLYFEDRRPGIHGTNAPKSIGQAPTLGCFRLVNDDVVDLEKRVAIGTGVVVLN